MLRIIIGSALGGLILVIALVAVCAIAFDEAVKDLESASDVTVVVGGDPSIAFSGSIGSLGESRTVEGTTPDEFTIEGDQSFSTFTAVIQKTGGGAGRLLVTLQGCEDGDKSAETAAAFGVVTITC